MKIAEKEKKEAKFGFDERFREREREREKKAILDSFKLFGLHRHPDTLLSL